MNSIVILIVLIFVSPILGGICFGLGVSHAKKVQDAKD